MAELDQLDELIDELIHAYSFKQKQSIVERIRVVVSEFPDFEVVENRLVHLLKHPNSDVRLRAAEILGDKRSTASVSHILDALLLEEDLEVKKSMIYALGKIGDNRAVPYLTEMLGKLPESVGEMKVYWHAADALGLIGDISSSSILLNSLEGDYGVLEPFSIDLRQASADALSNFRSQQIAKILVIELQKEQLHPIKYIDEEIRRLMIRALGELRFDTAIQPLIDLLNQNRYDLRAAAAEALGNFQNDRVRQALTEALNTEDEELKLCASLALKKLNY